MRLSPLVAVVAVFVVSCTAPSSLASPSPSPVMTVLASVSPGPTPAVTPMATAPPSASPSTTPPATPTLPATPVPPSPIGGIVGPWTEVADVGLGHVTELWAMAERDGIRVLSGQPPDETWAGLLWFSEDGLHWQRATMPAGPHIGRIHGITSTSTGLAALGLDFSGEDPLTDALVSADGRIWQSAGTYPGIGMYLAEIDGRLLAFGNADWPSDPWYSEDGGATWQQLQTESGRAVANGLLALHGAEGFLWAVRSDSPVEDASIRTPVELWRTTSGLDWEKVGELAESISVNRAAIGSGPNGWVIAARRTTFTQEPFEQHEEWFGWHSSDGMSWQPSEPVPQYVDQILADDHGFIGIGHNHGGCCAIAEQEVRQLVWASADGSTWRRLPKAGWHGREIDFITSIGERITGVGIDWLLNPGPEYEGWGVGWEVDRDELLP